VVVWLVVPEFVQAYLDSRISSPHVAAYYGRVDVLEPWLKSGGDPNSDSEMDATLLQLATGERGSFEAVAALLEHGANPNWLPSRGSESPLIRAGRNADFGTFVLLLESGGNIDFEAENGETVFSVVAEKGVLHGRHKETFLADFAAEKRGKSVVEDANVHSVPNATQGL